MEKSTTVYRKFSLRLLIIFLLFITLSSLYAVPSREYMKDAKFVSMQNYFFTSSDNTFYLEIPGCRLDDVNFFVNDLIDGVSFVSSSKTSVIVKDEKGNETRGTHLELTYRFSKTGTFLLPPMLVQVSGLTFSVPFERVNVFENPRLVQPELSVRFEKSFLNVKQSEPYRIRVGDSIRFTIYVRYASGVSYFSWDIPEDSLFTEIKRYDITQDNYKNTEFSPDFIPVVTFEWKPLKEKFYVLPVVSVITTGYNGNKKELRYPDYTFNVLHAEDNPSVSVKDQETFAYAFVPVNTDKAESKTLEPTVEVMDKILNLRIQERNSLFRIQQIREERQEIERSIGLGVSENERSNFEYILFAVLSVTALIITVVLIVLKKYRISIFMAIILCISLSFCIMTGLELNKDYSVYEGGNVYPIPEESATSSGLVIPLGSRIRVVYNIGNWSYIEYNDVSGWIKNDYIHLIK